MRIYAWQGLLQPDGSINDVIGVVGVNPVIWIGRPITVVLGLVYGYIPFMILPLYGFLDRIDQHLLEAGRDLGAGPVETFRRVTLPLSKPGILAGLVIVSLPMFGDYYTNNLLGGTNTSMFGNLIDSAQGQAGQGPEAASLVLILIVLLIAPDALLPAIDAARDGVGVSEATLTRERPAPVAPPRARTGWFRDPWRKPRFLQAVTWGYLMWSTLPVIIAIVFSFNAGRSRSTWQGFSLRWWYQDPFDSLWHDPALRTAMFQTLRLSIVTMILSVPLGTAFAIGIDRWHGRPASTANFFMLFSFVMPEIILGVSLFLLFTNLIEIQLGTNAQILGLVTFQISYPVIVVRARLLSIGREFEEAAMDLGASPTQALRRVLLPLLSPAILASAALVFADSVDNFVTVRYLSGPASTEPLSVKIYSAARSSPTPAVNAAATFMLVTTLGVIVARVAGLPPDRGQPRRVDVRRPASPSSDRRPQPAAASSRSAIGGSHRCRSAPGAPRAAGGPRPDGPARRAGPRPGSGPRPAGSAPAARWTITCMIEPT